MRIQANFIEIRNTGNLIQRQASEYEGFMNQMLNRMNELQSAWQGSDSQAFLTQLEALRPKMLQLKNAIDLYGSSLLHSANAYEQLQADRTASAKLL